MTVRKLDVAFVKGTGGYQDALGIYVNIRFSPTLGFMDRGDLSKRLSFLPQNRALAIGVGKNTFERYEITAKHNLPQEQHPDENRYIYPIKDGSETIGEIQSLNIRLKNGFIQIKVKGVVWIDWWPDANVNIEFRISPSAQNGVVVSESVLHSFDVDTGLFADFLAFLIGNLLGFIGGIFAVAFLENKEMEYEQKYDDVAQIDPESFDSAFAAFPYVIDWNSDNVDPFYSIHYTITNRVLELKLDRHGLSYAGNNSVSYVYIPNDIVTIIDKDRGSGSGNLSGIIS
ncbi:MAG: hypothetical protein ACFFD2_26460, partial [Promethearchaeota archaeon]